MKHFRELAPYAANHPVLGRPDPNTGGFFRVPKGDHSFKVIASWADGWDHVSVSLPYRCPTWEEMETIKRIFFKDDEIAVQYHVPISEHVNIHNYCLHLWRPHVGEIILPPKEFVG
ncbi:MAG: hypothetical protein GY938_24510 [Ketobacter sp.]|nr:hypothetical protein [Ketobacter sp.]